MARQNFRRRYYRRLSDFRRDLGVLIQERRQIKTLRSGALIDRAFQERLMLAVTEVNGCRYCAYAHAKMALSAGLTQADVDALAGGSLERSPPEQVPALLYAQHWAETDTKPDPVVRQRIIEPYGLKKTGGTDPNSQALGAFFENSGIGFRDVTDGTSNTIFVGERTFIIRNIKAFAGAMYTARDYNGTGPAISGDGSESNQGLIAIMGGGAEPINKLPVAGRDRIAFSSDHAGGANFCFGDGAVHFISETIFINTATTAVDSTFEYLLGIADANVIPGDAF